MSEPSWLDALESWSNSWVESSGIPRELVLFVVIVGAGVVFAVAARAMAQHLSLRGARLLSRLGRTSLPDDVRGPARAVGTAVFWFVFLVTVMVATEALGLPVVTVWLSEIASYVPRVIAAILIVVLGAVVAKVARRFLESAARSAGLPAHGRIGRATEIGILVAVGLVAVDQLGLEISMLTTVLLIVLGAFVFGAALAFGLGGRDWVSNVLSAHYVGRLYQVGQRIRVGQWQGRIVRITETVVILETADGELAIPAREFASAPSMLLLRDAAGSDQA